MRTFSQKNAGMCAMHYICCTHVVQRPIPRVSDAAHCPMTRMRLLLFDREHPFFINEQSKNIQITNQTNHFCVVEFKNLILR